MSYLQGRIGIGDGSKLILQQFHPAIVDHTRINPLIIRSNMFVAKMLTM